MDYFDIIDNVLDTKDYVYVKLSDGSMKVIVDVTSGLALVDADEFSAFSFSFTEDYEDLYALICDFEARNLQVVAIR